MAVSKWTTFVRQCLIRRISVQQFAQLLETYEGAIDPKRLFDALVVCRESFCASGDPLISLYIDHVGTAGIVAVSEAVVVLIKKWNQVKLPLSQDTKSCCTQTLQDITMIVVSPKYKLAASEARLGLLLSSRWLSSLARQTSNEVAESADLENNNIIEALAFLLASMTATDAGLEALSSTETSRDDDKRGLSHVLRTSLRQAFELCLQLHAILSSQLMERINTVLKHINLLDDGSSRSGNPSGQSSEIHALQFQVSIADTQLVASKAATRIFLESLLFTGSTIDDGTTVNYLSSRHQNDYQSMFRDVFVAAFGILKNQNTVPQRRLCHQQCQIFIQNKLPALLSMISASSFNSFNTEQAITDAWRHVTPLSSNEDVLSTGARLLHTCSLHHLMAPEVAVQLIGTEELLSGLSKGLYAKDDLVAQITSNHAKGPKLVEELVRTDGRAGSISQAIVEVMHNYCQVKETQYLKDLANAILRRPVAINYISLFVRPASFLGPLCSLLDDWRWDEIHGEAQPVYDDFGAAFLLILVTKARLGISKSGLGIRKKDGFLAEYLDQENSEESLESLSDERRTHLGNWINALYLAEGLSDELFTNCSPHDFYLLIPTLLRQSVMAYGQGKLTEESLRAGLEYLLEPFLLPSLLSALNWVGNELQEDRASAGKVLEVLVKSPGTAESKDIHQTILAMCASQLSGKIKSAQSLDNNIDSVLRTLDQSPEFSLSAERELRVASSEILSVLQQSMVTMIASAGGFDLEEQTNFVEDILALVCRATEVRGADVTLRALIGVLLQLSDSHDFLFALDTVSTVICVAEHGLRDALRLQYNNLGRLLKNGDSLFAEAVVRLHRQVEAYTNILTVQDIGLDAFAFAQQLTNIDTANPNLDGATGISGAMDMQTEQGQADGIDQVLDEVAAMGNLDSADADMSFDALYGLQNEDFDDLDLDNMF